MLKALDDFEKAIKLPPDHPVRQYVNMKVVFTLAMFLILYTGYTFYQVGFVKDFYQISCPENAKGGLCWNPIYLCDIVKDTNKDTTIDLNNLNIVTDKRLETNPYECSKVVDDIQCPDGVCNQITLTAGEKHGSVPWVVEHQNDVGVVSFLVAIVLNHLIWMSRKKEQTNEN